MSSRTLIRGGWVLTLGSKTPNFDQADVLIEEGRVAEIGPGLRARGAESVDATEAIVMPGFVDTHRHVARSLFRNTGEPGSVPLDLGSHYQPEDIYAARMIGLLGAAEAGITTVVDWVDPDTGEQHVEAALQAHADSGLRTVLALSDPPATGTGPMTTLGYGASPLGGSRPDEVVAEWGRARARGLRIHAHAGLDDSERGLIAELGERGALGPDVTLVHCSRLDDTDMQAIAASGAAVSLAPSSEMAGGLGPPPVQQLIDRGIRPGLGVDDESLAPGDIFAQMRATISIQHAMVFELKLAGKAGLPNLLSTRDVIRYATIDGARAVGLGGITGSLERGKQADVVVLRTDRPNIAPVNDPIGAVVWGMDTSNISCVLVGGEMVVREGELVADSTHARQLAVSAQRRIADSAGLMAGLGGWS